MAGQARTNGAGRRVSAPALVPDQDIPNPFFARLYHFVLQRGESERVRSCRRQLLRGLHGRVLEIGPGDGPNFALYADSVEEVIAVEPEPYLRENAKLAAARVNANIRVLAGTANRLPVEDASIDAVVCALVLCSVPDQGSALKEIRRALRPSGELRLYEHVIAEQRVARLALRAAQATFWPAAFGNCHPARDTLQAVADAGFDVSAVRRFLLSPGGLAPPLPHILGSATLITG
jgi:ubiquinone/menaquinone biosynthesis C-methylase UbiE